MINVFWVNLHSDSNSVWMSKVVVKNMTVLALFHCTVGVVGKIQTFFVGSVLSFTQSLGVAALPPTFKSSFKLVGTVAAGARGVPKYTNGGIEE